MVVKEDLIDLPNKHYDVSTGRKHIWNLDYNNFYDIRILYMVALKKSTRNKN